MRVPQLGERIRVLTYRYGGGLAGNVAAGAVNAAQRGRRRQGHQPAARRRRRGRRLARPRRWTPSRPRCTAATGRSSPTTSATSRCRSPGWRGPSTLPLLHPDTPTVDAAGVVSVVVFPTEDLAQPGRPAARPRPAAPGGAVPRRTPAGDHRAVRRSRRRTARSSCRSAWRCAPATRWTPSAAGSSRSCGSTSPPLPPYGPDGAGWPLGRTVRRAELEAVAVQVEGVEYVDRADPRPTRAAPATSSAAELDLARWEVPQLVDSRRRRRRPAAARARRTQPGRAGRRARAAAPGRVLMATAPQLQPAGPARPVGPLRPRRDGAAARRRRGADLGRPVPTGTCAHGGAPRPVRAGVRPLVPGLPQPPGGRAGSTSAGGAAGRQPCPGALRYPGGLAVDRRQRLYVAETGAGLVHVVDLWAQRLLRKVPVGCGRPLDVAPDCGRAVVLTTRARPWWSIDGRRGPRPGPPLVRPCYPRRPRRPPDRRRARWCCGAAADGRCVGRATRTGPCCWSSTTASDLDAAPDGLLVVGGAPGQPLRRFQLDARRRSPSSNRSRRWATTAARSCIAPDGRIAFTTEDGYGWTSGSAARHVTRRLVVTYRLDSGAYRTRWGRLFLDACLPAGTSVRHRFVTTDDDVIADPVPAVATRPRRACGSRPGRHPAAACRGICSTPPPTTAGSCTAGPSGTEQPWLPVGRGGRLPRPTRHPVHRRAGPLPVGRAGAARDRGGSPAGARDPGRAARPPAAQRAAARPGPATTPTPTSCSGCSPRPRACCTSWTSGPRSGPCWSTRAPRRPRRWPGWPDSPGWCSTGAGPRRPAGPWSPRPTRCSAGAARKARCCGSWPSTSAIRRRLVEDWQLRGLGRRRAGYAPRRSRTRRRSVARRPRPAAWAASRSAARGPDRLRYSASAHRFTLLVPGELTTEQRSVVRAILDLHRPAHTLVDDLRARRRHADRPAAAPRPDLVRRAGRELGTRGRRPGPGRRRRRGRVARGRHPAR